MAPPPRGDGGTAFANAGNETARVEAFSDGVIAIIITIMVLELRPPHEPTLAGLLKLWPVGVAYLLSFVQVGIYWVNHHDLMMRADRPTAALRWANLGFLFCLSLIPFGTAWWGEHPSEAVPTAVYLLTLLLPALAYLPLDGSAHGAGDGERVDATMRRAERLKELISLGLYLAGIALAFVHPALSIACTVAVDIIWIWPGKAEQLLSRRAGR